MSVHYKGEETLIFYEIINDFYSVGVRFERFGQKTVKGSYDHRVVIKSRGPGIFPGYYESGPRLLLLESRRKIEPKEIPIRLIHCLLVVFTRQLEILVTTLRSDHLVL